jgi:hypothetical protein
VLAVVSLPGDRPSERDGDQDERKPRDDASYRDDIDGHIALREAFRPKPAPKMLVEELL